jgi:hypothetical protein
MSLTYVIPDLHGRDDLLREGLAEITARGSVGSIVTIGDYVDKGPHSKQVIDRLLPGVAEGWNFIALKGNHDAMMVEALRDPSKMASWIEKGGDAALASYGGDTVLTGPAGIFGPPGDEHPELRRHDIQPLTLVLADPVQLALAAGTGLIVDVDDDLNSRQMRRQGAPVDPALVSPGLSIRC